MAGAEADRSTVRALDLRIAGLRNLDRVVLAPGPEVNLLLGANGAGKTSLVEGLHVLSHGRSFRTGQIDALVGRGRTGFDLFADVLHGPGERRLALGMARHDGGWRLRDRGEPVATLVDFVRLLPVVTAEPESHLVVTGAAEGRRRYLDWLLFHVEPEFLQLWRRYLRALRQRNAALRSGSAGDADLAPWESELASSGVAMDAARQASLASLEPAIAELMKRFLPDQALVGLRYRQGWPTGLSLADALVEGRGSDRERGFTQRGPHRSDWRLVLADGGTQTQLSRGQAKLAALACLLGQAVHFQGRQGVWPILVVDDLGSELDAGRQALLLDWLVNTGAQVFITATSDGPGWHDHLPPDHRRFHVEQGRVTPLL